MEALRQVACAGMDTAHQQQQLGMMNKAHGGGLDDLASKKQRKKEKVVLKKKLKLLKGLSKDLSTFSGMAFTLDHHHHHDLLAQVRGNVISEASDVLLKQLQQLRAEAKELKRERERKKQEKAKPKSPDPNSESDREEEPVLGNLEVENEKSRTSCFDTAQVCMGNKCKKSGGGALLEEFQRLMGVEAAVVACKCMGKCKNAPNVRLSNSNSLHHADAPTNPLFIGVALEDVGGIVANFLAPPPHTSTDLELTRASL